MAKINGIATYPENQKTVNTYDRNKQAFSDLLAIAGKDKEYEIVKWALSVSMFRHHALRHRKVIRSIMEPIERLAVRVRMPDNTEEHALAYFNEHIDTRKKEVAQCLQICFLVMVGEMKMTLEFSGGYYCGRDHCSVVHSLKNLTEACVLDPKLYERLCSELQSAGHQNAIKYLDVRIEKYKADNEKMVSALNAVKKKAVA